MLTREILEVYEAVDRPSGATDRLTALFPKGGIGLEVQRISGEKGETDFIRVFVPGTQGRRRGGSARSLGVIGRLGGLGARPAITGFVSDGDSALIALSVALKLSRMHARGDRLKGDVIVATHVCTSAPVLPVNSPLVKNPVAFMDSPVELSAMNDFEVSEEMEAILSIDTSRGTKLVGANGYAITPTVKQGWILKVSDDLLKLMEETSGRLPVVFPITMQDITPYGNGVYHFNSLLQPATATDAPLVGIALTSAARVPGCATGVTSAERVDEVGRYIIECAQCYGAGELEFYDREEFAILTRLYGNMERLQTIPE